MATSMEKSALGKGSDYYDEDTPMCEPCSVTGDHLPAYRFCSDCQEYLCKKCSTYHIAQKAMRNHTLFTLKERNKAPPKAVTDKCSHKCDEHKDKRIKYFCEEHSTFGCSVCFTMGHKQCNKPVYIPEVSEDITNQTVYKTFEENLKSLENAYKAAIDDVAKLMNKIAADESQIKTTFTDFRKRLNEALDQLEKEVTTKAKKIQQDETGKLKSMSKELEKSLREVDTLTKKVASLLSSGQRCDLFVMVKQEESQLVHLSGELDAITRDRSCQRFEFRPNNDLLKPGALGSLVCHSENVSSGRTIPAVPVQSRQVKKTRSADNAPSPVKTETVSRGRPSPAPPATRPKDIEYWQDMARRIKVGDRVRQGRDWSRTLYGGNEDGGGLGTVICQDGRVQGYWYVRWDYGGGEAGYAMGGNYGDHYQLEIVEES